MKFLIEMKKGDFQDLREVLEEREWVGEEDDDVEVISQLFVIESGYHQLEADFRDRVKIVTLESMW